MRVLVVGSLLMLAACGGGQKQTSTGVAASEGAPEWVHRGSVVQRGSIFGVGSVSGIGNAPLAQDTARNRARAEISKILETYSASLMKDYQASTTAGDFSASSEEQHVEQAIKTFSANLMNGTEQKDMWLDGNNNTWWVLVELNFDRSREAAAVQAQMSEGLKGWVDQNGDKVLEGMESETGPVSGGEGDGEDHRDDPAPTEDPPPPPPPARVEPEGPPAKVGGAAPGWTQGKCDRGRYLCGVGDGADRKSADIDARAELARIFESHIASVATSFEGAASTISNKTGEKWVEVQKVSQYSMVSTDRVISMSEIIERWDDGKGRQWSLAVIEKAKASKALRDQIEQKDGVVSEAAGAAKAESDKLKRLQHLKRALASFAAREAMNSDLIVIDGKGLPSPQKLSDLLALLDQAAGELSLAIALTGNGAESVRACLEQALTDRNYQIEANIDEESEEEPAVSGKYDVIIKGTVKNEKRGKVGANEVVMTTLTLKLVNGQSGKILRTITGTQKGTRNTVQAAASTSAVKICKDKVPSMVGDIDRFFGR
jgi:hypothetical protein